MLVRQPVKDVSQDPWRDMLLRYFVVAMSLVVLLGSLLVALGSLGATLGFEESLGLPRRHLDLITSFIEGTATVAEVPSMVLSAGDFAVLLPLLGFISVGIPAALLALARPRVPGARLPRQGIRTLAATGAVIAILVALAAIIWCIVPWRTLVVDRMPVDISSYVHWRELLDLIAGIDVFIFASLLLWCILGFRFPIPRWGRAFTTVILIASAATVFVAMSRSTGISHGFDAQRPLVDGRESLVLGEAGAGLLVATVTDDGITSAIETGTLEFSGRSSLDEVLREVRSNQGPVPRP